MKGYFDKFGLLHANKGKESENGPLFLAELVLFHYLSYKPVNGYWGENSLKYIKKEGWYDPNPASIAPNGPDVHLSHDNMLGIYALTYLFEAHQLGNLPLTRLNSRLWLHPTSLGINLLIKESKWGLFFLPWLFVSLLSSLTKSRQHTSGKCMWLLRLLLLSFKYPAISSLGLNICDILLRKEHGDQPFKDIYAIYFLEGEHPIHNEINALYKKGIL